METSATINAMGLQGLGEFYDALAKAYALGGLEGVMRDHGLVLGTAALALLVLVLLLVVIFMPSRRKVVKKRRVRVTRYAVAAKAATPVREIAPQRASEGQVTPKAPVPRWKRWIVPVVWGVIVLAAFVATYVVTGSNGYCGQSCHVEDPHVVAAIENEHADCIDCHEGGPITGGAARLRMAVASLRTDETTSSSVPVDPARCLGCHGDIASETVEAPAGLRVSHEEILSSGRACSDCHSDVGHNAGRSFVGGMSRCTVCHDGEIAASECETCHAGGSPLVVERTVDSAASSFVYSPVQVANRDCSRCHGRDQKCVDCHNGFVLPHSDEFRTGGHARIAAFAGKDRCFKCHSITWCGTGSCHNAFSPHDEKTWPVEHRKGTSKTCGSCHVAWDGQGNWCDVCH